jgi:hypothetical protein
MSDEIYAMSLCFIHPCYSVDSKSLWSAPIFLNPRSFGMVTLALAHRDTIPVKERSSDGTVTTGVPITIRPAISAVGSEWLHESLDP